MTSRARSRRLCAFSVFKRKDLIGRRRFRHDDADDGFRAQRLHRLQAMIAVGRPVAGGAVFYFFAHDDDRVEEAAELGDDAFELARVGVGQIALIGRRLDLLDGKGRDD